MSADSAQQPPGIDGDSWQDVRQYVLDRDGHACRFCGTPNAEHKSEHGRGLHAHHIIPDSDGGKDHPKNLITVCASCHKTLESTHAQAVGEMKRHEDCAQSLEELADVFDEYRERRARYEQALSVFIERHPAFAKAVGAYTEEGDLPTAHDLDRVVGRRGDPTEIDSEFCFAAAYGYQTALRELVYEIGMRDAIPRTP